MKRCIIGVGIAILLCGFISCGKQNSSQSMGTASTVQDFPGGWKPTTDLSKKVKITEAAVMAIEGYDYNKGDAYAEWWSGHFNTELDVTSLSFENWAERIRIWATSGDLPDVSIIDYMHPDFSGWVEQGLIKKFPDNWRQRWPNLAKVHDVSGLGPQMDTVYGGTYFIARPRFVENLPNDPIPNHPSFYFRKDWANAVGFPIKDMYTTSDLIEFGRLIKEKDPGKIGSNLIPIVNIPDYVVRTFVDSNSTHSRNFYKDKDGQYKWGGAAEDTLKGLKLMYQAYSEGILDRNFYLLNFGDDQNRMFTAGIAGGCFYNAPATQIENAFNTFKNNVGLDPYESLGVATVLGDDNLYHQEDILNFWAVIGFNPNVKTEVFERYMDMMDFGCTNEGFYMINMGLKGIDWEQKADGEFVSLLPEGQQLMHTGGKYPSMGDAYVIAQAKLFDDFSFQTPSTPKVIRDLSWKLYKDRSGASTPDTFTVPDWTLYCFDSPSKRKAMLDYPTAYSNLVTEAKSISDLESLWRKWIDANKTIIDPVLLELNNL